MNDSFYSKLIHEKRVIIVGPAPSIENNKWGPWIDNFDIVIRTNGSISLLDNKNFTLDYGKRCDVLYVNEQFSREMRPFPYDDWQKKHLQILVYKSSRYLNLHYSTIPARTLIKESHDLAKIINFPLYGPMIIRDVLEFSPKELWITGFDFYTTKAKNFVPGNYKEYTDGYLPEKIKQKSNITNTRVRDTHDKEGSANYIKNLYDVGKIKMDSITKTILFAFLGK